MILKGSKIYLQEGLREEDYALILKGYQDLGIIGFVNFAREVSSFTIVEEAKKFVNGIKKETVFGIYTLSDEFVGYATLEPEGKDMCEYAIFILDNKYKGRGIGTEVTEIMINYVFNKLEFKRITLTTSEFHSKAIALYEKMGFKKTKLVPNDREIYLDGKWIQSGTVEMALCK